MQQQPTTRAPARPAARIAAAVALLGTLAGATAPGQDAPAAASPAGPAPAQTAPAAPPPQESPAELRTRRDRAQEEFLRLYDAKRYDEALAAAQQVADLTRQAEGERSVQLVTPLRNVGEVQLLRGELADAERQFVAAIGVAERAEGMLSTRLISPLVGLGNAYLRAGLPVEASVAWERALQVNHANLGLYNTEQIPVRDGLAEAYLAMDRLEDAGFQQAAQVEIQRHRGGDDARVAAAMAKLGRWYTRTGEACLARQEFVNATILGRKAGGDTAPVLAEVYQGHARSYLRAGDCEAVGPNNPYWSADYYLHKALDVLEVQPVRDTARHAEVLVDIADLYHVGGRAIPAREHYARAWAELDGSPALLAQRDGYFSGPTRLAGPPLPTLTKSAAKLDPRRRAATLARGSVTLRMTLAEDGRPRDLVIVESQPAGLMDAQVLGAVRDSVFRPLVEDGVPVRRENVTFRHEFRYPHGEASDNGAGEDSGKRIPKPPGETQE